MVKHIVLYTLREGVDKEAAVELIASQLEPLVGKIEGLNWMEINGLIRAAWTMPFILNLILPRHLQPIRAIRCIWRPRRNSII